MWRHGFQRLRRHSVGCPRRARRRICVARADVEAFGREFGLVKRVVKLVTPAVVHIEAEAAAAISRACSKIEEAGSGVIVQFGAKPYVLTNRHVIRHSSPEKIEIHLADGRVLHPDEHLERQRNRRRRDGGRAARAWPPPGWATATRWRSATSCWPSAARSA